MWLGYSGGKFLPVHRGSEKAYTICDVRGGDGFDTVDGAKGYDSTSDDSGLSSSQSSRTSYGSTGFDDSFLPDCLETDQDLKTPTTPMDSLTLSAVFTKNDNYN